MEDIITAAAGDIEFRNWAVTFDFISLAQALSMPGGFVGLMESVTATIPQYLPSYPFGQLRDLGKGAEQVASATSNLTTIGRHLLGQE